MGLLPFKTHNSTKSSRDVSDGMGNVLPVPCFGSVTYREVEEYNDLLNRYRSQDGTLNVGGSFKADVVELMLRSRFSEQIPSGTTKDKLLTMPDGSPMLDSLIDALYEFFQAERNRHAPSSQMLQVNGEGAKELAISYAKEKKAVVASRPDFEILNTYLVFRTEMDVLLMNVGDLDTSRHWQIIESFAPESEAAPAPKQEEKPTGQTSTGSSDTTTPESPDSTSRTLQTAQSA